MKILLTVHQFLPDYSAGTEILTYSVAKELIKLGHEVRVFAAFPVDDLENEDPAFDEYSHDGIFVYKFSHSYRPTECQSSLVALSFDNKQANDFFNKILCDFSPEIIHFFHLNRLGTGLIESAANAGIPAFFTPTDFWSICSTGQLLLDNGALCQGPSKYAGNCIKHMATNRRSSSIGKLVNFVPTFIIDQVSKYTKSGFLPAYPFSTEVQSLGERLEKNVRRLNMLKKIFSPNSFMSNKLISYGVDPSLIVECPFGVDRPDDSTLFERGSARTPFRIGFIGTLLPHKGCHVLLEAFRSLPVGAAVLLIYGDESVSLEYSNKLRVLADGREDVEFRGTFQNSKISEVLSGMDALVVPSLWFENTPLVIYSAQNSRCPVVASNFQGISEVIRNHVNGLLFDPGDYKDLANKLIELISSPALYEELVANSISSKTVPDYVGFVSSFWMSDGK